MRSVANRNFVVGFNSLLCCSTRGKQLESLSLTSLRCSAHRWFTSNKIRHKPHITWSIAYKVQNWGPLILFWQPLIAKYKNISLYYIKFFINWCFFIFCNKWLRIRGPQFALHLLYTILRVISCGLCLILSLVNHMRAEHLRSGDAFVQTRVAQEGKMGCFVSSFQPTGWPTSTGWILKLLVGINLFGPIQVGQNLL